MSKEKASQKIGNPSNNAGKKRLSPAMIIILVIVILAIVGIILWFTLGKDSDANLVVTPDNVKDVISKLNDADRTPVGSYEVSMNTDWDFKNSTAASDNAYVGNSVNNTNTVYFTIALDGSDEDIYKSPYIPVGSDLKNITLDKKLDPGTYKAVLTYHLVDDSYKEKRTVAVRLNITIEN